MSTNGTPLSDQTQKTSALYESSWVCLSAAVEIIITLKNATKDDAQCALCQAIVDGAVGVRAHLRMHAVSGMRSSMIPKDGDFSIPTSLSPAHFDWEASRPWKPWTLYRERFHLHGSWYFERLEVRKADVVKTFGETGCNIQTNADNGPPKEAPHEPLDRTGVHRRAKRRGRSAKKFNATKAAMLEEIQQGAITSSALSNMLEKELTAKYRVSRDTARRAREAVLSEMTTSSTISTIDK